MTKAELIKQLEECGDDVEIQVSLEYKSGEIDFFDILFVSPSNMKEFSSLINITTDK